MLETLGNHCLNGPPRLFGNRETNLPNRCHIPVQLQRGESPGLPFLQIVESRLDNGIDSSPQRFGSVLITVLFAGMSACQAQAGVMRQPKRFLKLARNMENIDWRGRDSLLPDFCWQLSPKRGMGTKLGRIRSPDPT